MADRRQFQVPDLSARPRPPLRSRAPSARFLLRRRIGRRRFDRRPSPGVRTFPLLPPLEEMQQKLEARKMVMGNMSRHSMLAVKDTKTKEEQLSIELRSLLVAGTALSIARKQLEESNQLPSSDKGYVHLKKLAKYATKATTTYDITCFITISCKVHYGSCTRTET
ncbi:hypothetical protein ACFX2C_018031 [Malus domestica]